MINFISWPINLIVPLLTYFLILYYPIISLVFFTSFPLSYWFIRILFFRLWPFDNSFFEQYLTFPNFLPHFQLTPQNYDIRQYRHAVKGLEYAEMLISLADKSVNSRYTGKNSNKLLDKPTKFLDFPLCKLYVRCS